MHLELMEQVYEHFMLQLPEDQPIVLLGDGNLILLTCKIFAVKWFGTMYLEPLVNTLLYERGESFQAKNLALSPQNEPFVYSQCSIYESAT